MVPGSVCLFHMGVTSLDLQTTICALNRECHKRTPQNDVVQLIFIEKVCLLYLILIQWLLALIVVLPPPIETY